MRILLVLGILVRGAWGCSCMVSPAGNPPCQSAWQHQAVFTGTVEEITDPGLPMGQQPFPQRKVRMRIAEAFRGVDPGEREIVIETGMGGGDCGYAFKRGVEYIVYATKNAGGVLSTGICSPTRPVADAAADLQYLRALGQAKATTEIRVTAIDAHGPWRSGVPGLAGTTITIDGPGVHQSAVTDAAGRHVFSDLPAGQYSVDGSLEGYTKVSDMPAVRAPSKGCAEVFLPLQLDRVVSGRVLTGDGQPAAGVVVEAVPTRPRHENDMPMAADSATVDSEGRYELWHLTGGEYYLGISLDRTPTLKQPYTRWFHPGTEDPAAATIVHVAEKPEVLRFDLTLPDPQHARTIRGTVYWPDGRPAAGVNIFMEDPRWSWQSAMVAATTDNQGRFEVHGLDGTRYVLRAAMRGKDPISAEPAPILPGPAALDLRLVLSRKGYGQVDAYRSLEDWRKGLGLH